MLAARDVTPVRHITLERRRRKDRKKNKSKDQDAVYDDAEQQDNRASKKAGYDANGYDDGSWKGDNWRSNEEDPGWKTENGSELDDLDEGEEDGFTEASPANISGQNSHARGDVEEGEDVAFKIAHLKDKTVDKADQNSGSSTDQEEDSYEDDYEEKEESGSTKTPPTKSWKAGSTNETESILKSARADAKSDCSTLAELFDELGGSAWFNKQGWEHNDEDDGSCCQAFGVDCDASHKVTALNLGGNGLSGSFPSSVFKLSSLIKL